MDTNGKKGYYVYGTLLLLGWNLLVLFTLWRNITRNIEGKIHFTWVNATVVAPLNAHPCAHLILFSISASVVTCFTSPSEDLSFNLCRQRWWRKASLLPFGSAVANVLDGWRDSLKTVCLHQDKIISFTPLLCLARVMLLRNSLKGKLCVYFTHTRTHIFTQEPANTIYTVLTLPSGFTRMMWILLKRHWLTSS